MGHLLPWPGDAISLGCIWSIDDAGRVHAVRFRRRPLDRKRVCALHPAGGGCWRPLHPMKSHVISVPSTYDATVCLQPRTTDATSASSLEGRCFQRFDLVGSMPAETLPLGLCLRQFVDEAVEQLLKHAGNIKTEIPPEVDTVFWTPAVLQLLQDVACKQLCAVTRPTTCPDALDGQLCSVRKLQGTCPSRTWVNASGCFRLLADRYIVHLWHPLPFLDSAGRGQQRGMHFCW